MPGHITPTSTSQVVPPMCTLMSARRWSPGLCGVVTLGSLGRLGCLRGCRRGGMSPSSTGAGSRVRARGPRRTPRGPAGQARCPRRSSPPTRCASVHRDPEQLHRHSRNIRRALRPVLPLSRYTTLQVHVYAYGRHHLKELVRGERQPCVRHRAEDGGHGSAKGGTEGSCNPRLDRRQLDHVKRQCEELALCSTEVAPGA